MYIDHSRPPFIDITLPPAIIVSPYQLTVLYSAVLFVDYYLLSNERSLRLSTKHLRLVMTIYHIMIPLIFISNNQPLNIVFCGAPWFLAAYSAQIPSDKLTLQSWPDAMMALSREENTDEQYTLTKIRLKGASVIALGIFKLVFDKLCVESLLPNHAEYALEYSWLNPMSWFYTFLFGLHAYCLLGTIEIFLGLQQLVCGWKMVEINNYPLLSTSQRDFWSRRWNNIIHRALHKLVFTSAAENTDNQEDKQLADLLVSSPAEKLKGTELRVTNNSPEESTDNRISLHTKDMVLGRPSTVKSFWSTRRGRGLAAFLVSGFFHELIIMSTCRKITLEHTTFFLIEGLLVMLEVDLRQGIYKQEPTGITRVVCIIVNIVYLSIVGRLFTGPFLRYEFFS